jgi:hypothetical protein
MKLNCFKVKWETVCSPGRNMYQGEVEVFGQDIADAEYNARRKVAQNLALARSEVLIVDVRKG